MFDIVATNLTRTFINKKETVTAVEDVNLNIKKGEIFGLLGPNGAGKSTLIKMFTTTLLPTSGELKVLGHNVYKEEKKIRSKIGLLYGGEQGLYWQLSGRDNLLFFGSLFNLPIKELNPLIDYWIERVGLKDAQNRLVSEYSKGMKQRLHIARCLLHDPDIIFMDEPTLGLDPKGTIELRNIILEQKKKGKTILLTTHDMEEAQDLCDRIAFLIGGKIIKQGTLMELQDIFQEKKAYEIELSLSPEPVLSKIFSLTKNKVDFKPLNSGLFILNISFNNKDDEILSEVVKCLTPYKITQIINKNIDLREMYLTLVNNKKLIVS